jgi:hypothetical protein
VKKYTFTSEEKQEIKAAREKNRDKNDENVWRYLNCEQRGFGTRKSVRRRVFIHSISRCWYHGIKPMGFQVLQKTTIMETDGT